MIFHINNSWILYLVDLFDLTSRREDLTGGLCILIEKSKNVNGKSSPE